jgi:transmembrane sensor
MSLSSSHRLTELFDRYLRRDLAPAEVEEFVSLLGQADAEELLTEPMRRVWEELKPGTAVGPEAGEHSVDWDRMFRRVSRVEDGLILAQGVGGRRREVWRWRAVAALFFGLAGVAAYWSVSYRSPGDRAVVAAAGPVAVAAKGDSAGRRNVLSWQTSENKKVVHLPDGSIVILNKQSSLEYKVAGIREVTLNGEAYFDIVHRPEQAFLVHTGSIVTRVLGTAFNIKAYSTDKAIEVTVDHGKVQVLKGAANMGLLSDKQQMWFDRGTETYHEQRVSLKPVMAWKPVEISFDDITMEEAARKIGERFKVDFAFVNPSLKACRITATFYMEDDLDQIMTVICGVNQSKFEIRGGVGGAEGMVTIDGKGCN